MTFRELMESKGVTGYQLDKVTRIGISPAYMLLNGKKNPLTLRIHTAAKVVQALNITLDEFYNALKDSYEVKE